MTRTLAERLWDKVAIKSDDECWPWLGSTGGSQGYGRIWVGGKPRTRAAHAVAWELFHGKPIPEGMEACHSCDNPICANPHHVFPATHADNLRDGFAKGRMRNQNTGRTHCRRDHPLSGDNLYVDSRGRRHCRACWAFQNERRRLDALCGDERA